MGREVKRVALDFDWPLETIWQGYLNRWHTHKSSCGSCAGSGYSPTAKRFHEEWYGYTPFDPVAYGAAPLREDDPVFVEAMRRKILHMDTLVVQGHESVNWFTQGGRVSLPDPARTSIRPTPLTWAHRSPRPGAMKRNGPPFESGMGFPSISYNKRPYRRACSKVSVAA